MSEITTGYLYDVASRSESLEEYKKLINEVSQSDVIEVANKYFSKPDSRLIEELENSKTNNAKMMQYSHQYLH